MPMPFHTQAKLAVIALTFAGTGIVFAQAKPPIAPVRDVPQTYFGTTAADPYRYMENMSDPEVASYIKAQADYTNNILKTIPGRAQLYREVAERGDAASARISSIQVVASKVYYLKQLASENIGKLYVRDGFSGKERLLVDPDIVKSADGKHTAIDYFTPSPDNKYVAYGISVGGSEQSVLHVVEVATAKQTKDVIDRANFGSPSWLPDGRFLYNRLQKMAPNAPVTDKYVNSRVFVHKLGDDPESDPVLAGVGLAPDIKLDPAEIPIATKAIGSNYVVLQSINGTQREIRAWTTPLSALAGDKTPWVKVADTSDEVNDIQVSGDNAYLLTHKGTPRFKVLRTSLAKPDIATADVVVPATESVVTAIATAKDALYLSKMNGGNSELFRVAYAPGSSPTQLALPFVGDLEGMVADPREPGASFNLGGWVRFGSYFKVDPKSNKVVDTHLVPQGKFDNPTNLVETEVKAKAPDGTMIPMSIVHKKGLKLDGSNPTILWGYGTYGISQTPFFRPTYLPWFDRGGVFAVAHVRGGGEYGEDWYKAGYKATKPNTWHDAIACAEWLVANKYTSSPKMSIMGGSAGGIFVGRSITERPELFGAAVDQVPWSDMLRVETSANGVPNIPEFGTVKDEEGFKGLYAMSSYHWVRDGEKYPAVLVTTGLNDPRVDAWQAAKMAARLQAASASGKPVLLRVDFDAGHGYGSTKSSQYELRTDVFAFLLWQAGVKGFQP
jgi:prolyl oligopeptidase